MQVSLMSPFVFGLIAAAAILLGLFSGVTRQVTFLALNLTFLLFHLLGLRGTLIAICFILAGYLLVNEVKRSPKWAVRVCLPALVVLFLYLKNYAFLEYLLPQDLLTTTLSTVGMSFLFFKIVHVVIEARSNTLGAFDALTFAGYCTNFTTFAMGPIQRYHDHYAQWFDETFTLSLERHLDAVIRILLGLLKAYVFAEWVRPYILISNMNFSALSIEELLLGIYAFNVYLYLNFSGYCDVMIGAGTLLGLRPPENFDKPFIARNVSDYWQRHHRSLTLWLTDYIYTPTLKRFLESRRFRRYPLLMTNISLIVTMAVSGIWHGTTFGFMLFGLLHGIYQVVYRTWDALLTRKLGKKRVREFRSRWWVHAMSVVITFNAVSFALIFFQLGGRQGLVVLARFVGL